MRLLHALTAFAPVPLFFWSCGSPPPRKGMFFSRISWSFGSPFVIQNFSIRFYTVFIDFASFFSASDYTILFSKF